MPPLDAPFSARLDASDLSAHWLPFTANRAFKRRPRLIDRARACIITPPTVITGFGRLGHAFAAERYGVVPDMICFAKGVTNGAAPLGGVLVRGR